MFSDKKMFAAGMFKNAYNRMENVLYTDKDDKFPNKYMREIWYDELDYDYANNFYKKNQYPISLGACSSMCSTNFLARNYDWTLGENVTFIVHTEAKAGRYKTIGVANTNGLTKDVVESGKYSLRYKLLPFSTLDGINEHGLCASTNVVPIGPDEHGYNTVVNENNPVEVNTMMLVRYVLDNCKDIDEVKYAVNELLKIYTVKGLLEMGYTQHYIFKDAHNNSTILEFIEGTPSWIDNAKYMTNFHITGVTFNSDGTVDTPAVNTGATEGITPRASGLERYNIIVSDLFDDISLDDMKSLLNKLNYTNAYKNIGTEEPVWYTEFTGLRNLKATDTEQTYIDSGILEAAKSAYDNRSRKLGNIWQSTHSSIYDLNDKKLYIRVEEGEFVNDYKQFEL